MAGEKGSHTSLDSKSKAYGEPLRYDPDFNGPIKNRGCTDVICLAIFIVFILGWIIISVLAFKFGQPEMLVYPTDSAGNICGEDGKFRLKNKPYLYFFDLSKCLQFSTVFSGCQTPQVCVSKCPTETFIPRADSRVSLHKPYEDQEQKLEGKLICKYNVDKKKTVEQLLNDKDCAEYTLKSDPLMGRCIPFLAAIEDAASKSDNINITQLMQGTEKINKLLDVKSIGEKLFSDFKKVWPFIIICLLVAMGFSLIWIIIMRWIAWFMVWLSILLVIALLSVGCWYSFNQYTYLKNNPVKESDGDEGHREQTTLERYKTNKTTWLVLGIILAVVLLLLLLIIIFLRNRIRLAIALIQESSKAVGNILSSLFFPLVPFILQLGVIAFWIAVAVHLASASFPKHVAVIPQSCSEICKPNKNFETCDIKAFNNTCKNKCPDADCYFLSYDKSNVVTGGQIINLFGLFWGVFFIAGLGEMVLAGAFATWYWTFEKRNVPTFVISASFCRTLRYHLGSLAFGSLLIAIVRMIRVFLEYIDRKLKEYSDNVATKILMCCLKCCFWCLEKFIKFINRNAYIMIAVYGKNFCVSAKNAFFLLMRNVARVVVLDKVTDFLLFLGKLTIVSGVGLLSFFYFSGKIKIHGDPPQLNYYVVPVAVVVAGSYVIANCFFNVYSMAVDTLFLCFLEDCEMNDGSVEKPYRMPKKLMKILGKKNKLVDPAE